MSWNNINATSGEYYSFYVFICPAEWRLPHPPEWLLGLWWLCFCPGLFSLQEQCYYFPDYRRPCALLATTVVVSTNFRQILKLSSIWRQQLETSPSMARRFGKLAEQPSQAVETQLWHRSLIVYCFVCYWEWCISGSTCASMIAYSRRIKPTTRCWQHRRRSSDWRQRWQRWAVEKAFFQRMLCPHKSCLVFIGRTSRTFWAYPGLRT